MKGYLPIPPA